MGPAVRPRCDRCRAGRHPGEDRRRTDRPDHVRQPAVRLRGRADQLGRRLTGVPYAVRAPGLVPARERGRAGTPGPGGAIG
ncbi:hypothetical protein SBRY_60296 [Actinacidiphila bryophytorum]|uniref:Uncharacterized protein n=1 Tax=Actinacidiphila bryophytorum TaxID=1436133 RepID=A0A9W4H6A1_9ACTN|nr:hypothetical protein SBRY_60296 [Actinacidiphila bryophytorum]